MPLTHDHHHPTLELGQEHQDPGHAEHAGQAQILDLDARVLADHITAVTAWLPVRTAPMEIVDLGAGTGAGAFALLNQFPHAHVTAVDSSAAHLERLRSAARTANLNERVRIVQADLDAGEWPDLGKPDLVWASASMHHLAHPDQALRKVHDLLAPAGLMVIVELPGLPRFLPTNAPEASPGLEQRCHAASQQLLAEHMPHRGADWGPKLTAAGFTLEGSRVIDVHVDGSESNAVAPYALAALQSIRNATAAALAADDLAALDQLLDITSPQSILRRDDLAVRTTRTVWAARPSGE